MEYRGFSAALFELCYGDARVSYGEQNFVTVSANCFSRTVFDCIFRLRSNLTVETVSSGEICGIPAIRSVKCAAEKAWMNDGMDATAQLSYIYGVVRIESNCNRVDTCI